MEIKTKSISSQKTWITGLIITLILGMLAFQSYNTQMIAWGYYPGSIKLQLLAGFIVFATLINFIFLGLLFTKYNVRIFEIIKNFEINLKRLKSINLLLLILFFLIYLLIIQSELVGPYVSIKMFRLWLFWGFSIAASFFLAAWNSRANWLSNFFVTSLIFGTLNLLIAYFPEITDYPLSLGWSEISRYYQASFFFSERIYNIGLPLPVTHPSRYLVQAIPFFFPSLGLAAHRTWQVILWWVLPLLTGFLLCRRMKIKSRWMTFFITLWIYIFLMQGAVYYHLLFCILIVVIGFNKEKYWHSMLVVLISSIWAGLSRVNWFPVPGMVAAALMYLEVPVREKDLIPWRYFWKSFSFFVLGSLTAVASYFIYVANSGVENLDQFNSSYTSTLLWNRLLPNPSFSLGILPGILLVAAPLLIIIKLKIKNQQNGYHRIRIFGIASIVLVLFFGGLVVSAKVGGATNLHNMDAFLVLVLIVGLYLCFDQQNLKPNIQIKEEKIHPLLLTFLVCIPVSFAALKGGQPPDYDHVRAQEVIDIIDGSIAHELSDGGEILFISQRQLITFNLLDAEVPLVHEYEKIFLMEMAMSHNEKYLDSYYSDIKNHRFDLIIIDPIHFEIRFEEFNSSATENNIWVAGIVIPTMCAYDIENTFEDVYVQVLSPREETVCPVEYSDLEEFVKLYQQLIIQILDKTYTE